MAVLVRQRRAMWEDMGVQDRQALDQADKVYRPWAMRQLTSRTMKAWLAQDNLGRVVGGGCLWLQPIQPQPGFEERFQPYLMSMFTERGFRAKGVGSKIVEAAVEWCRRNGYAWFVLHASRKGRRLYRGLGFKRTWEMELEFAGKNKGLMRHGVRVQSER